MQKYFSHKIKLFFKKIKNVLPAIATKKSSAFFVFGLVVLVGVAVVAQPVHAQEVDGNIAVSIVNAIIGSVAQILLFIAQLCIKLTVFALDLFIKLVSYNGFIDAPIVIIGWTMIRDIANMFFVVVLLAIAFGTILGIEQYEWKKTLAKFMIAAILINFSRLIAGLIIDAAHVFTMTFVNAISATAGGNIINMLHLEKILKMAGTPGEGPLGGITDQSDIRYDILVAAMLGVFFAAVSLMTIGAYALIIIIRVVVLWVLIILSPMPYIFSVLQKTKSYSDEWWSEFINHVLVAPIAVFFLWLAFATLGSGDFAGPDLGLQFDQAKESQTAASLGLKDEKTSATGVSLSEISSWENMANFIIAVAFLWIGLERVQKMGVKGGEFAGKVQDYAKTGAYYSTVWAGKKAAYHAPFGGRFWARQGSTALNRVKLGFNEKKIRQAESAAKRDKEGLFGQAKKGGFLGATDKFLGKAFNRGVGEISGGMVGDSRARADKRAEDWKETVERQEKILDESYGTGSASEAGLRKTAMTARLQQKDEFIAQKKEQKVLDQRKSYEDKIEKVQKEVAKKVENGEILEEDSEKEVEKMLTNTSVGGLGEILSQKNAEQANLLGYYRDTKLTASTMAKKEVLTDNVESRKKVRAARARDEHEADLKDKGKFDKDVMGAHARNVEEQELTRVQTRDTNRRVENERADYYEETKGDQLRANAIRTQSAQTSVEEDGKLYDSLNHRELVGVTGSAAAEIASKRSTADPDQLKNLHNQLLSSVTAAFKKSGETGTAAMNAALKELGWPEDEVLDEHNRGRAMGSLFAGRVIGEDEDFDEVIQKSKAEIGHGEEYGDEQFNQKLRLLFGATYNAGTQGALNFSGLIDAKFDPDKRKTDYSINKEQSRGDADYIAQNDTNITNIKSASGFGSTNLDGNIVRFSEGEIQNFAAAFSGANSNKISNMSDSFWQSLAGSQPKTAQDAQSIQQAMFAALEAAQPNARKAMILGMKKTNRLLEDLGTITDPDGATFTFDQKTFTTYENSYDNEPKKPKDDE